MTDQHGEHLHLVGRLVWSVRQPDHFDWFSRYLGQHGLTTTTRWLIALTTLLLGIAAEVALASPAGPQTWWARVVTIVVGVAIVGLAGIWWVSEWPTRRQSLAYAVVGDLCIGAACVAHAGLLAGATGCIAFAALGGYIGFFHGARLMVAHIVFSTATVLGLAVLIALDGDPALAVSKFILITVANFTVPVGTLISFQLLNTDAARSHTDPLTGLLNRRGLAHSWTALLAHSRAHREDLLVMVIDIDRFKNVNDTYGHDAGDRVLTGVSDAIRRTCRPETIVARIGGEEFVVADAIGRHDPTAHRLVAQISTAMRRRRRHPRCRPASGTPPSHRSMSPSTTRPPTSRRSSPSRTGTCTRPRRIVTSSTHASTVTGRERTSTCLTGSGFVVSDHART